MIVPIPNDLADNINKYTATPKIPNKTARMFTIEQPKFCKMHGIPKIHSKSDPSDREYMIMPILHDDPSLNDLADILDDIHSNF